MVQETKDAFGRMVPLHFLSVLATEHPEASKWTAAPLRFSHFLLMAFVGQPGLSFEVCTNR